MSARDTDPAARDRARSKRVGALAGCGPSCGPTRLMLLAALAALVLTAGISLLLPLAVRRVVDSFEEPSMATCSTPISAPRWRSRCCSPLARGCATTSSPGWASGS